MIGVGLYGQNGHQIQASLAKYTNARFVAAAAFKEDFELPQGVRRYADLDGLLGDSDVSLVSLCSPLRRDQADDAVRCMKAGKHVYAEKPCALDEAGLDRIMAASCETGMIFHEMAGTYCEQPYLAIKRIVASGGIGTVVQVFAQKSYPLYDGRPQDENVDGGLLAQAGVHATRFIEHVAGVKIKTINALETSLANPVAGGGLKIASVCIMELENGGVACMSVNYLNPPAIGTWGNECLRIFGDRGMIEATDGGTKTRLVLKEKDFGPIDASAPPLDFFGMILDEINGKGAAPMTLEDELHPTRMVIRAKRSLD